MLRKFIKIFIFCFLPLSICGQNTIALPGVTNYSKQQYGGGLQNWKVKQDKNGILYFANNEGLLTFDGRFWNVHPLPNKTIVHSVEINNDNKVYVGGQDEAGFFAVAANGKLKYQSIVPLIPAGKRSFSEIWDIVSLGDTIFFRSTKAIYILHDSKITVSEAGEEWLFLEKCRGVLYAQDAKEGLMRWRNEGWEKIYSQKKFTKNDPFTGVLSLNGSQTTFTTLKSGIFHLVNDTLNPSGFKDQPILNNIRIYCAAAVNEHEIALGTSNEGLIIINENGDLVQRISTPEGLQNYNILSLLPDREGNIWLGLDNGIDMIAYNNAIKILNPLQQNGSGYTALIRNNHLYLGTTNGLYTSSIQDLADLSFSLGNFSVVQNTKGQTWKLSEINKKVLLGHHEGGFEIKENEAIPISTSSGFWNFLSYHHDSLIIAGTYNGVEIFSTTNNVITYIGKVPGFEESSRYLAIDTFNNIWVSHPYHGIFKITADAFGKYSVEKYSEKNGLPSLLNNHIFKIKHQVVAATTKGIYTYNYQRNLFEPSLYFQKILGNQSIRYLKESPKGNIWFVHDKSLSVMDFTGSKPTITPFPQLTGKILSGFEFVYPHDESNVIVGGEKGFFLINYLKYKANKDKLLVQVRSVKIFNGKDSLLFGGYFRGVNEPQLQAGNIPAIGSDWKTLRFEFSANSFEDQNVLEYAYRLKGFDNNWSEWTPRTEKEYTNLGAGNYFFEVKVRKSIDAESKIAMYSFKMLPPWYLTKIAFTIYLLCFAAGLFLLYKWLKRKFRMQRVKYEEEQKKLKYIYDLEQNKTRNELIALQNEKLEAEIGYKNSELAASAMHLVKKGELLTKIKKDLSQVTKDVRNPEVISAIKQMVKKVGEDDKIDEEWENFARHFDSVHSAYLVNLKTKHPNLTGNELKLCANLRMNLSSKEIAQLLNISLRGVEVGRYRLRKKLGITSEVNLFDYLMSIK